MKKVLSFLLAISLNLFAIEKVKLTRVDQIIKPQEKGVKAVTYNVNNISLEDNVVQIKKENFINLILPSILKAKEEVDTLRKEVEGYLSKSKLSEKETRKLEEVYKKYKVEVGDKEELLRRLNTVPVDLALAQAILESGWGTSRFFKEGNNVYGIWSFSEKDNRMESTHGVRNGKKVYLKKYDYLYECVRDYYFSLSVGLNYKGLRKALVVTKDSIKLSENLLGYSEIGDEYIKRIKSVIKFNKLTKYNDFKLVK